MVDTYVGKRAVVLGAGVAGLFAARVLADAYEQVTVVDRDALAGDGARRAVPQGRHIHGLLARGQQILEELFPGLTAELGGLGVPVCDFGLGLSWFFKGRAISKAETGLICVSAERPLLEDRIRARIRALPNVRMLERTDIIGLTAAPGNGAITGVRLQAADAPEAQTLSADLVVDASGRSARTPRWLAELGYPEVPEERIKIDLTYTTAEFAAPLPNDPIGDGAGLVCVASPDHPRGATLVRLRDRYALSLYGLLGDVPPTDRDGFLEFARSLPVPEIYSAVEKAELLTTPVSMHFPANVRRRYERLPRLPEGLLAIGDAACVFNPIYAQGMTSAAIQSLVLRKHLAAGRAPRPRAYFRDLAAVINAPWDMAVGGDLGFPGVEGSRTLKVRMGNFYIPRLQKAAAADPKLSDAFLRAAGLVDPPQALMRPGVISRVLRAG